MDHTAPDDTFQQLVAPLRTDIHAHCYRMLGSIHDADDATQETLLRAWRGLSGFQGRSAARTWLFTIATRVCFDAASRRARRALPIDLGPASATADPQGVARGDISWMQPYPDQDIVADYAQKESVELAFVAALQHLSPNQRAALLLFEVLGFSAPEIADMTASTTGAVTSALQRARATIRSRQPEISQQQELRSADDPALRKIVGAYTSAIERADTEALITLLTDDATWSMPPRFSWYAGLVAIRDFLERMALRAGWRHLPTSANGQLATAGYCWDPHQNAYIAYVIDVLTLRGGHICAVTSFIDSGLFPRFGLPLLLAGDDPRATISPAR